MGFFLYEKCSKIKKETFYAQCDIHFVIIYSVIKILGYPVSIVFPYFI